MVKLGVTGGIGSGKSYVCRMLAEDFGIPIYNCDIHARVITLTDIDVISQLTALDSQMYDHEGELDKVRLAQYMFASEANYKKVNGIIHPAVRLDLHEWLHYHRKADIVAVESAILYESHFETEVDRVLFVDAPLPLRIERVTERDGISTEQIQQRISRQQTELARQRADFVLLNDGHTDLHSQLSDMLSKLSQPVTHESH